MREIAAQVPSGLRCILDGETSGLFVLRRVSSSRIAAIGGVRPLEIGELEVLEP
jgi:hypothetical protein